MEYFFYVFLFDQKIEVINIIIIIAGAKNLIRKVKVFLKYTLNNPPDDISLYIFLVFQIYPTSMQIKKPPIGIIILSDSIMRESKIECPKIVILLNMPNESEAMIPININPVPEIIHAFFLDHFLLSIKYDAITSINDIADVTAAKNTRRKKIIARYFPYFMWSNIYGRVLKSSPEPAVGSRSKAKTAGSIAVHANIAIIRSKIGI